MAKAVLANLGLLLILVLIKIDSLNGRCVEVVVTGEGCECSKNVPYEVRVPVVTTPPPYEPKNFGYKLEMPVQTQTYTYAFDFVVEEPKVEPIPKPVLTNLIARIDRVAAPKQDCIELKPPTKNDCSCGSCAGCKNRYLNIPLETKYNNSIGSLSGYSKNRNRIRRSLYSKKRHANFVRKSRSQFENENSKVANSKSRLVKRDIKGEFDLINRDAPKLEDLQIPEIIQYMPEVLSPNFQRGKCMQGSCLSIKNDNIADNEFANRNRRQINANEYYNAYPLQSCQVYQPQIVQPQLQIPQLYQPQTYQLQTYQPQSYQPQTYQQQTYQPQTYQQQTYQPKISQQQQIQYQQSEPASYSPKAYYGAQRHQYEQHDENYQVVPLVQQVNQYRAIQPNILPEISTYPVQPVQLVRAVEELPNVLKHPEVSYLTLQQQRSDPILGSSKTQENYPQPVVYNTPIKHPTQGGQYQEHHSNYHQQQLHHQPQYYQTPSQGTNHGAHSYQQPYGRSSNNDMDHLIREIIYKYPDFIASSDHGPGQMVPSIQFQRDEARDFLQKLLIDKVNRKLGVENDNVENYNYQGVDGNRYRRQSLNQTEPEVTTVKNDMD